MNEKVSMNLIKSFIDAFKITENFSMGQKNSACKTGWAVKSGVSISKSLTNIVG